MARAKRGTAAPKESATAQKRKRTTTQRSTTTGEQAKESATAQKPDEQEIITAKYEYKPQSLKVGEYQIEILGDEKAAIAKVTRNGDEVILDQEMLPHLLPPVAGNAKEIDALHHAHLRARQAYHDAVNPVNGLIDVSVLIEHPYNAMIYGENENISDLVDLLLQEDGQIFELISNPSGQVLSGNRRLAAAKLINERDRASGDQPRYQFVPVKIQAFDSVESELKSMLLHNKAREKTPQQKKAEVQALIDLGKHSAIPIDAVNRDIQEVKGGSRADTFRTKKVFNVADSFKDQQFASDLKDYAMIVAAKADEIVRSRPPKGASSPESPEMELEEYFKLLFNRLQDYPTETVQMAKSAVDRGLIVQALGNADELEQQLRQVADKNGVDDSEITAKPSTSTKPKDTSVNDVDDTDDNGDSATTDVLPLSKLIQAALAAGDKPADNRKTPKKYIELCMDAMPGGIDLDSFAMLTDRDRVPAVKSYTILEDGFSRSHVGNVFANPPFSRASEAINLFSREISQGNTKRLFLILPVSCQSTKAYHKFLENHDPLVLQPSKRLAFEPGELLALEDPDAKAEGNREPSIVIYWSSDDKTDYPVFHDSAIGFGWVAKKHIPFNPFQLPGIFAAIEWQESDTDTYNAVIFGISCNIFPAPSDDGYKVLIAGKGDDLVYPSVETAKYISIMKAIASLAPATPF